MIAKVNSVVSDNEIELDQLWEYQDKQGRRVKIAGLLPGEIDVVDNNITQLSRLILYKNVELDAPLFVSGDTLYAYIKLNGKPIQDYFPDRKIPGLEPPKYQSRIMQKAQSGIPLFWKNPLRNLAVDKSPFFGNIRYPVKFWERDYEREKRLVEMIYVDSHQNKEELDNWWNLFLNSPEREAPLIIIGEAGIGKSWWISHSLLNLPRTRYHTMVIDLRYTVRGEELRQAIHHEIDEYLTAYIKDLSWLYPEYEPIYGECFNPSEPRIRQRLIEHALDLTLEERNRMRLRFYDKTESPKLVIAFDNIDHFNEQEELTVLDLCRRIIGYSSGVKLIVTMRPRTIISKARLGLFFGDSLARPIVLKSPDVYDLLIKRLSTNNKGESLDIRTLMPQQNISWKKMLDKYRYSEYTPLGLARLVKQLCGTNPYSPEKGIPDLMFEDPRKLDITYDARFYLKLFRRILYSDHLGSFENIDSIYFGIQALLLAGSGPMEEYDAFLFNLFDNNRPQQPGNALIRYRVLEYVKFFRDVGELFNIYFEASGYEAKTAHDVLGLFVEAGLVKMETVEAKNDAYLTTSGARHLDLIDNQWYIICIKTGMNIYKDCILWGEEAKNMASNFVTSERLLNYYAEYGWVSDEKFVEFLASEEALEHQRRTKFVNDNPELREQINSMSSMLSSPATLIYYSIKEQTDRWRKSARTLSR